MTPTPPSLHYPNRSFTKKCYLCPITKTTPYKKVLFITHTQKQVLFSSPAPAPQPFAHPPPRQTTPCHTLPSPNPTHWSISTRTTHHSPPSSQHNTPHFSNTLQQVLQSQDIKLPSTLTHTTHFTYSNKLTRTSSNQR